MAKRSKKAQVFRRRFGDSDLPDEPELREVTEAGDYRLLAALNYYNQVDIKDKKDVYRRWIVDYAKEAGFTPEELTGIRRMEDWRVTNSMASISRLISNGCSVPDQVRAAHDCRIRDAVERYMADRKPSTKARSGPAPSNMGDYIILKANVDDMWDKFWEDQETFSVYDYLTTQSTSAKAARMLSEAYARVLEEFRDLQRGDREMKEAYPRLKRPQINKIVEQAESIVRDSDRYALNLKKAVVRKPRKRKEKSAADMVKGATYLKAFPDLQLVSVDPSTIVGSRQVWLYSTKYKVLRQLVGEALTVKGSTVHGWDPEASTAKTLRKPQEVLSQLLTGTSVSARKIMPGLKTKPMAVNGRINGETIIVRTFK